MSEMKGYGIELIEEQWDWFTIIDGTVNCGTTVI